MLSKEREITFVVNDQDLLTKATFSHRESKQLLGEAVVQSDGSAVNCQLNSNVGLSNRSIKTLQCSTKHVATLIDLYSLTAYYIFVDFYGILRRKLYR